MAKCIEYGCDKQVQARGLCSCHYGRWLNSEVGQATRMKGYGRRRSHPLYEMWRYMNRTKVGDVCQEWADFWVFVGDVIEKPSNDHKLRRKDSSLPISKDNYEWVEIIVKKENTETYKEYTIRYQRDRRDRNPGMQKHNSLMRSFGIGLNEYNIMVEKQNGLCAICNNPPSGKSLRAPSLAVDHCHSTGKIRELLCNLCNAGLGQFRDNIELIEKAILYLKKHNQ